MFTLKKENYNDSDSDDNVQKVTSAKTKSKDKDKKQYTQGEIDDLIKNTIIIPKDKWMTLEPGIFISYYKTDNTFVKGGYIQVVNTSKSKRKYFRIVFSQNDSSKGYTLYLDTIKTIYKKIDETSYFELHAIREAYEIKINDIKKENELLKNYIQQMEKKINDRFNKCENHSKQILLKIKELHNL